MYSDAADNAAHAELNKLISQATLPSGSSSVQR
jgi:hypothetical protein